MGFMAPRPPPFELDEWEPLSHNRKMKPIAQDWAMNGFGSPVIVYFLYLIKLVIFVAGAIAIVSTTAGVGSFTDVGDWWTLPVVYEKFAIYTMVWEILGFGCGSMPLTLRFIPPIGGFIYFLRPGTMRLAPWPKRIPLTAGTTRTLLDNALYLGVVLTGCALLVDDPLTSGKFAGELWPGGLAIMLGLLVLLGLRDKTAFLASRPEQYAPILLIFCFDPGSQIMALKLVMLAIWWGAATSKLNKHFPFVVAVMISNSPLQVVKAVKRRLWRDYPNDMLPSRIAQAAAHGGTIIEFTFPAILLFSRGGTLTTIALVVMIAFHAHILSTFPLGVPLEWNLWVIYSALFLFGHDAYAKVGFSSFDSPLLGVLLAIVLVGIPVLGNIRPDLISFLPSMRYYAGNWAASVWLFAKDGSEAQLDRALVKPAALVTDQLTKLYGEQLCRVMMYKGLTFRAMHHHGRAITGLLPRAVDDLDAYDIREGELVAGLCLGWNFGDGHLHNERLLEAVQERCHFTPGRLRVIYLESQPIGRPRQHYRILDAATGLVEEGYVEVADMVSRQPWLDETDDPTIPVHPIPSNS